MSTPYVSVIVPVYNVEKYLDRCVLSLINQTENNIEIILVDDGSTDSCPEICEKYKNQDPRIKVLHKENQGLGFARNSGLELAVGKYVYFVDSDDYLDLNAVKTLYQEAHKENLDVCFGGTVLTDEAGTMSRQTSNIFAGQKLFQPEITDKILTGMLGLAPDARDTAAINMSAWQGLYLRKLFEDGSIRFPSEREFISEDIIFHIDILPKINSMKYLSEYVYYHVVDNSSSLTHRFHPQRFEKCTTLYLEEIRRISALNHANEMKLHVQELYLGNVRLCLKQLAAQREAKGKKYVYDETKKILNNSTLQSVLAEYPFWQNPIKRALFSYFVKKRYVRIVISLSKVNTG